MPAAANTHLERASAPLRPELLRAIRSLREMPPFAREREIDFGRYSHFSPEERAFLRSLNYDH
jgi:hypothetical protein